MVTQTTDPDPKERSGFRPMGRRRMRMLAGAMVFLLGIGGNLAVYSSLDARSEVLQLVRDVPAGEQISAQDLRPVEVWLAPSVNAVPSGFAAQVVGAYARVRLVAGSLIVSEVVQEQPLVTPGAAVLAIEVSETHLPTGLREQSSVLVVVVPGPFGDLAVPPPVPATVVGLPVPAAGVSGRVSISLELALDAAVIISSTDAVRLVLLDPLLGEDPAEFIGGES